MLDVTKTDSTFGFVVAGGDDTHVYYKTYEGVPTGRTTVKWYFREITIADGTHYLACMSDPIRYSGYLVYGDWTNCTTYGRGCGCLHDRESPKRCNKENYSFRPLLCATTGEKFNFGHESIGPTSPYSTMFTSTGNLVYILSTESHDYNREQFLVVGETNTPPSDVYGTALLITTEGASA